MRKDTAGIVFLVMVVMVTAKTVTFKDCATGPPAKGAIKTVDIEPCTAEPCPLKKGTNVSVSVVFNAGENATVATGVVHGLIADVPVPFPLPHPEACGSSFNCPLQAGTMYRYNSSLAVKEEYPSLQLVVEWELQDEKQKDLFCFEVPVKIVS
ncbi:NPC intracellular cholesterol transporter 2-like [Glandiceps talaboti]